MSLPRESRAIVSHRALRSLGTFVAVLAAAIAGASCGDAPEAPTSPETAVATIGVGQEYAAAALAQERHAPGLLRIAGVVGAGVGLDDEGRAVVRVFTLGEGVEGVPRRLDGVPTDVLVTGMFVAGAEDDPTTEQRPAPNGFSIGHPDITAGTLGALVTDGSSVYILSNNHVLANSNDASVGDPALQPGPFDGGTLADQIGSLAAFVPIDFSGGSNTVDAAIAGILAPGDAHVLGETPSPANGGYGAPGTTPVGATIGLGVKKYGRTTGLTSGSVSEVNLTVDVCYEARGPFRCVKAARFVDQFAVGSGAFSDGGDSGSLIVTDDGASNPVGLLFAGSSTRTIGNRFQNVRTAFAGKTLSVTTEPGSGGEPPPPPPPDGGDGFVLTATGTKVRGLQKVDLTWTGATSTDVDVYRDNGFVVTTANDGAHRDEIDVRGGGSYTYRVCEAGTQTCSNEATVTF